MKQLQENILRLYNHVKSKNEIIEDALLTNDPLYQLHEIESSLLHMFEKRDFIESKIAKDYDLQVRFKEAERSAEKIRK